MRLVRNVVSPNILLSILTWSFNIRIRLPFAHDTGHNSKAKGCSYHFSPCQSSYGSENQRSRIVAVYLASLREPGSTAGLTNNPSWITCAIFTRTSPHGYARQLGHDAGCSLKLFCALNTISSASLSTGIHTIKVSSTYTGTSTYTQCSGVSLKHLPMDTGVNSGGCP